MPRRATYTVVPGSGVVVYFTNAAGFAGSFAGLIYSL
jgi:hypothetical protein